jgi:hypothetical protein
MSTKMQHPQVWELSREEGLCEGMTLVVPKRSTKGVDPRLYSGASGSAERNREVSGEALPSLTTWAKMNPSASALPGIQI